MRAQGGGLGWGEKRGLAADGTAPAGRPICMSSGPRVWWPRPVQLGPSESPAPPTLFKDGSGTSTFTPIPLCRPGFWLHLTHCSPCTCPTEGPALPLGPGPARRGSASSAEDATGPSGHTSRALGPQCPFGRGWVPEQPPQPHA